MDVWDKLYKEAIKVQKHKIVSPFIEKGQVASALLTKDGNIYTGVCIDSACGLGMCAERNAVSTMLSHDESQITKLVAIMSNGELGLPCGACRELLMQLDKDSGNIEILIDLNEKKTILLKDLVPSWWGIDKFE